MTDELLRISELFRSIQGESTWAGLPCLFVRLSGCNLRCTYCDSSYTWKKEGTRAAISDILEWVDDYPGTMVELTGGEPLLQEEIFPLMEGLLHRNRTVLMETNGSLSIDRVPEQIIIILDLKCPDSGMEGAVLWKNIDLLCRRHDAGSRDEIKFVISSDRDFLWAKQTVAKYGLNKVAQVLFSPNEQLFSAGRLAELLLQDNLPVRLQLQLHKILWPGIDRGV